MHTTTRLSTTLGDVRRRWEALQHAGDSVPAEIALQELEVAREVLDVAEDELESAHRNVVYQHRRYRDLFDAAPDPYVVTDLSGTICEVNRAACSSLHAVESILVGKPLAAYVAVDHRRAFRSLLARLPQLRCAREWATVMQPRQARAWPASISVAALERPGGGDLELRWLVRDVSERRRRDDEMRQWKETLEARVLMRTVELEEKVASLEEALRRAEAAPPAPRPEGTAGRSPIEDVAHELRTAIGAAVAWVGRLSAGGVDEPGLRTGLRAIELAAESQLRLLDDVLEACDGSAAPKLERQIVDLGAVVASAVGLMRPWAERRGLVLEGVAARGGLHVHADAGRIQQVVCSLVSIAMEAASAGRIEVRCAVSETDAVVLIGAGAGGLEPTPAGEARAPKLASARRILEAHGGAVAVSWDGPGGASFRLSLPLRAARAGAAGLRRTDSRRPRPASQDR